MEEANVISFKAPVIQPVSTTTIKLERDQLPANRHPKRLQMAQR